MTTTHHSPLTTHHSPLTTHHSPLTTHHSPLTSMPNSDLLEYLIYQQQLGGGGAAAAQVWLQVALLVCLFLAGIFRPEVVRAKPLFRMACVLLALSLLVSPTLNFLLGYLLRLG